MSCDSTPTRLATFQVSVGNAQVGAVAATDRYVFFANYDSAAATPSVTVLDVQTHALVGTLDLPKSWFVYGIVAQPGFAYIAGGPGTDLLLRAEVDGGVSSRVAYTSTLWCAYGEQPQFAGGALYWVQHECENGMSQATGTVMSTDPATDNSLQLAAGFYTLGTDGNSLFGNERSSPAEIDAVAADGTVTPAVQNLDGGQFQQLGATPSAFYAIGTQQLGNPLYRVDATSSAQTLIDANVQAFVQAGGNLYYAANRSDGGVSAYSINRVMLPDGDAGVSVLSGNGQTYGTMAQNSACLYYLTRNTNAPLPTYVLWTVSLQSLSP